MKTTKILLSTFLIAAFISFTGCKKDNPPPVFNLVSLMADGIDLAGVTTATDVPEDAVITAVFSSDVDPATATDANFAITLTGGSAATYTVASSGSNVTITPTAGWDGGSQFDIELSTSIKGTNGVNYSGNSLTFKTSGIFVPEKEYQVLFVPFDGSTAEDAVGSHTITKVGTLNYVEDRRGTSNSAAYFDGEGNLVEVQQSGDLISGTITMSYWFKTDMADYDGGASTGKPQTRFMFGLGVEKGYFLEIGRRSNDPLSEGFGEIFMKFATNHINIGNNGTSVPNATAWSELNSQLSLGYEPANNASGWSYFISNLDGANDPLERSYIGDQVMGKWTNMVMTFDATSQTKTFYINGVKWAAFTWVPSGADWLMSDLNLKTLENDGVTPVAGLEGSLAIGFAGSSTNAATGWADYQATLANTPEQKKFFKGGFDQLRIFSVALTESEVQQLYDSEK